MGSADEIRILELIKCYIDHEDPKIDTTTVDNYSIKKYNSVRTKLNLPLIDLRTSEEEVQINEPTI